MKISGQQNSVAAYNNVASKNNKVNDKNIESDQLIQSLRKQIESIEKQIQNVSENDKLSLQEKMKKRVELQGEIQNIKAQIIQRQTELKQEKIEKEKEKAQTKETKVYKNEDEKQQDADKNLSNSLIGMSTDINTLKRNHSLNKEFKNRKGVLEQEIKLDESRTIVADRTVLKRKELAEIKQKINKSSSDIMDNIKDISEKVAKYAKEEKRIKDGKVIDEDDKDKNEEEKNKKHISIDEKR